MAKQELIPFKTQGAPAVSIKTEINDTETSLFLGYKLTGNLHALDLGTTTPHHARVVRLWEKTCFEFFIKNDHDSYMEFNFSPVFEWNAFYFEKKGNPLTEFLKMDSVKMDILHSLEVFHLIVEIEKKKFPEGFFQGELKAGITSVIKDWNGELSYWALSHADTRPNFHHFDSFKYRF